MSRVDGDSQWRNPRKSCIEGKVASLRTFLGRGSHLRGWQRFVMIVLRPKGPKLTVADIAKSQYP